MDYLTTTVNANGAPASSGAHEPFTLAERFQQLAEIDNPLSTPADTAGANLANTDTEAQVAVFKEAMDSFLTTLHSVDVRLKRQIWGLEEAGIISLKESKASGVSLEPNGVGDIGNLDVGWLNSRSNKVDRDMEAELWSSMKATMESLGHKELQQRNNGSAETEF
ncbi:hypothetical protein SEUCBS139899_010577 [Sporothrix eucalyptigena]|uniref:Mediator of RNA polymerase II transcription subunit 11 n=1 Tax=Sporothrix eucalyptigena TaxID=1812306 RepID=A0ABP0CAQ1_9PEZI